MERLVKLGDVLKYEQPTKYIVETTNYNDMFKTPVLTAGQTFILGYTDETQGIFTNLPVIIFDDFTTAIKFVDFPFKVKSSAMKILKADEKIADIRYLFYRMQSIKINTDTHKRYWISKYAELEIALPPLPVQQKIAAILDAAEELRQKDKALVAKYDELTQALFLDMFGDPISNPKGWKKVDLDSCLLEVEKIGKAYTEDNIEYVDIASVDNVRNIITKTTVYQTKERPSRAQQILLSGDIVFSTVRPNLKNVAVNQVDGRIGSTGFFVCRTDDSMLNNFFLYKVLLSDSVTDYFVSITSGANYPAVKSTDMKKFQVICPSMNLQNQFAERLKIIESLKSTAQVSALKSEELFNSLLQKAFNGELV
jgi:type I restriction enzyme S subunit